MALDAHGAAQDDHDAAFGGAGAAAAKLMSRSGSAGLLIPPRGAAGAAGLGDLTTMFTGIVQGIATVHRLQDQPGLRSFTLQLPPGFDEGLAIGASVACDGTCLTVTARPGPGRADFDVMQQSLALTTLGSLREGSRINVERAARDGAEIGGHRGNIEAHVLSPSC